MHAGGFKMSVRRSVCPSVPVCPRWSVYTSNFLFYAILWFNSPQGYQRYLPAPRRVKIKKQNLGIFCRRDPSYRTFVLIVLHKTNLLVTLSHKLSFFANFWFDAAPRPCGLHDALSVMQCGDMWCYARWIYTRWSVVEMEILTLVWCHWRNRDTWFLGDDISMTQRFQKSLYLVSLFLQWWNAVQLNKINSEVHAKLPWALMPWVWCSMVF